MTSVSPDLTGEIALITGCAGLLGPVHADALIRCGAFVVVTDIDEERALQTALRLADEHGVHKVIGLRMDVTDRAGVAAVQRRVLDEHGCVGVLVNNAAIDPKVDSEGGGREMSRFEHFPLDQWEDQIRVGLTGAFVCCQVFGTAMAAKGRGVIVNIASDLSVIGPDQRLYRRDGVPDGEQPVKPVSYSVTKTGLVGLTRYLATYWADKGVRVNALSPGGVFAGQPPAFVDRLQQLIPMQRMAVPNEYVGAIQFLCSDASRYMTGQNLVIDGGRSVW